MKPELLAPGVGLGTAEPGRAADGKPAFGAVSGSSAAAAVAAGAAALLAEARPDADAQTLRALLVGGSDRIGRVSRSPRRAPACSTSAGPPPRSSSPTRRPSPSAAAPATAGRGAG